MDKAERELHGEGGGGSVCASMLCSLLCRPVALPAPAWPLWPAAVLPRHGRCGLHLCCWTATKHALDATTAPTSPQPSHTSAGGSHGKFSVVF